MSRIDDIFANLSTSILNDWGQDLTYIKTTLPNVYDPTTGTITQQDTAIPMRGVITRMNPREYEGLYQSTDIKVIIGNFPTPLYVITNYWVTGYAEAELGTYYPTEADKIQYVDNGATRTAKIISITTYRGDNAILHTLIARPQ